MGRKKQTVGKVKETITDTTKKLQKPSETTRAYTTISKVAKLPEPFDDS